MNTSIYLQLIFLNKTYNNHFLKRYVKLVSFYKERNFKKKKFLHHEHHIIPKSFGGPDTKENLVFITIREHFILHWILYKAFPKSSMTTTFFGMCSGFGKINFKITSKVHEKLMLEFLERQSENAIKNNKKKVEEGKHNFSGGEIQRETNRKRVLNGTHNFLNNNEMSRENCRKMIENGTHPFSGPDINKKQLENGTHPSQIKKLCKYCNRIFSSNMFARYHDDKCKLNPLFNNESKPKVECPHCNKYFSKSMFTRWHGDKCKLKSNN